MRILLIKLGATGDVVRTTTLLHVIKGDIDWLTSDMNHIMLKDSKVKNIIPWSKRETITGKKYDLIINLEDESEPAKILRKINYGEVIGAYVRDSGEMAYTNNLCEWFDLSLISRFGKVRADELKIKNRMSFQEIIFKCLGYSFSGQMYHLPISKETNLEGDIAIAADSGAVWPMKKWAYYDELKKELETLGYKVNYLPIRKSLLEHIRDVQNHKYLISGDSLPMHIALGSKIKCLSLFICTSPWEIYDYGILKKVVSPMLDKNFYKKSFNRAAVESIKVEKVFNEVLEHIKK
jgi:heptosyltransferase-2